MKSILKYIIGIIIGISLSISAAVIYKAKDIEYKDTNIEDAINDLYYQCLYKPKDKLTEYISYGATINKDPLGNYYFNFDGIDDYLRLQDIPATVDFENGFTVEFTAEWNAFNNWSRILDIGYGYKDNIAVANYVTQSSLDISFFNPSWNNFNFNSYTIPTNTVNKYKIECKRVNNSFEIFLYVNDEFKQKITTTNIPKNTFRNSNFVGKSNDSTQGYFKGKIYELIVNQSDGINIIYLNANDIQKNKEIK